MTLQLIASKLRHAIVAACVSLAPISTNAADYFIAEVEVDVTVWTEKIWDFLEFFCELIVQGGERSNCIEGAGDVGSIRQAADGTQDLLIARGPLSYTYQTVTGPKAALDYHVTIRVVPIDELNSTIIATLLWDEEPLLEADRLAAQFNYPRAIQQVLWDAKTEAEAS